MQTDTTKVLAIISRGEYMDCFVPFIGTLCSVWHSITDPPFCLTVGKVLIFNCLFFVYWQIVANQTTAVCFKMLQACLRFVSHDIDETGGRVSLQWLFHIHCATLHSEALHSTLQMNLPVDDIQWSFLNIALFKCTYSHSKELVIKLPWCKRFLLSLSTYSLYYVVAWFQMASDSVGKDLLLLLSQVFKDNSANCWPQCEAV